MEKKIYIWDTDSSIKLLIERKDFSKNDNYSWINKYKFQNIKYLGFDEIKDKDVDGIYDVIQFGYNNLDDKNFIDNLIEYMNDSLSNSEDLKTTLESIIFYFRKLKMEVDTKKLHGDIGEALFLLKCLQIDPNVGHKLAKSMHTNDDDPFDFSFENNCFLDIKTTSKNNSEINYSSNQTQSENMHVDLVVVKTRFLKNQTTILDLYNLIQKFGITNELIENKIDLYSSQDELINNNSVSLDDYEINFYKREYLPINNHLISPSVKKVTYTLDATDLSLDNEPFYDKIIKILNR